MLLETEGPLGQIGNGSGKPFEGIAEGPLPIGLTVRVQVLGHN